MYMCVWKYISFSLSVSYSSLCHFIYVCVSVSVSGKCLASSQRRSGPFGHKKKTLTGVYLQILSAFFYYTLTILYLYIQTFICKTATPANVSKKLKYFNTMLKYNNL